MSHHCKSAWVIGGLLVAVSQFPAAGAESLLAEVGRNPFERISTASCDDDRKTLAGWRLQGIVRGADYHIWLGTTFRGSVAKGGDRNALIALLAGNSHQ